MGHKNIEVNITVIREESRQEYNSLISAIYKKKRYILLTQYTHIINQHILHPFLSTSGSLLQDTQEESKVHYLPQLIFILYGVITYTLL